MAQERTGLVVVRVWIEASDHPLRVRVTETPDLTQPEATGTSVVGTVEEAVALVRDFLGRFALEQT